DHMIETLTSNGTNDPLHIGSLPRGSRCAQHFLDAHVSHLFSEGIADDGIAVAEQVTRELVEGKCLPQLLSRPLGSRMGSHVEVKYATAVMRQYQEHVKHLEAKGGHREDRARRNLEEGESKMRR